MIDPPSPKPADAKSVLRLDALRRRTAAYHRVAPGSTEPVTVHGLKLVCSLPGRIVGGYMPMREELDCLPLMAALAAKGYQIALPVIETRGTPLLFRGWSPGDPLRVGNFDVREPLAAAPFLLPDILLAPLAAFDSAGYRIGYGGGYYDRTLSLFRSNRRITAIGLAFDEQEVPLFPHEAHDQRLDYLLTPTGVRNFGA